MYKKILIRYGELVLKGKNRTTFIKQLGSNIKEILNTEYEMEFDRMYIPYSEENLKNLKYVFGISSFSPVIETNKNLEDIQSAIAKLINKNASTFKIAARRNDKSFELNSDQLNNLLGGFVLKNSHLKVNVKNPDQIFNIEIRKNSVYVFDKSINGIGGIPVGISGKVLHLISGGFDSPVAAYLLMKRGFKVDFLTFVTPPQTDETTIDKIKNLTKVLSRYQKESNLYVCDFSLISSYIEFTEFKSFKIILMRRSFYRIASELAKQNEILMISNGENLAQVASQTNESMAVIGSSIKNEILRPLLTYDKNEIINLSKVIETHDISILKSKEACELFAPKNPVTKPTEAKTLRIESKLDELKTYEEIVLNQKMKKFAI
ncbi:tRNA uracil 4-sulfurtransferase ThiI [Mycoplasmopsis synoviae]|uniref:Probable tRNA sulfurtransferase n=1 Tax=Mycoplasmopsis synoviae TaxID=2109 RepID=A0A2H4CD90_MYCSY|nr:tRNA uracil 4-sulfurtransferase ThiI [Mycoplasmopsis synoviae]AKB11235.1 thiamine biosynthesis protein ThiI [Mycoplasmopsis synoviae ATCC 25204]AKJ20726.1 tRNA S(4)U 4-thiouridine synthase (former ThiI) [Mycoplasmopsis synoviae]AQU48049.1 tRNA S(4)U 4-thiouridine synthase (former ThiI) [Mycoplasmopsis synoviae]AWL84285.1 tRNA 4-thiouridine(8) synthase ThiI [Mycoplasmopsis synoviae]QLE14001.1 tRNA 4-thiouridine(8) synthase ThiI [Mycoplasmopsis synoviae]